MAPRGKSDPHNKTIAENRRARFDYHVHESVEAGIVLTGTEVKALREGKANIAESYCSPEAGPNGTEIWLINATILDYSAGNRENHDQKRPRKLLLSRREIGTLTGAVERKGFTIMPLRLYFNNRGIAKLAIALAEGKKLHDKRDTQKARDWSRQKQRLLRENR
ncbi:SsrA-binding protein [Parvularcula bermudensis HTCC2503]|uniref:SsrA-binding protein n=1 Tax=Parvularcula bermudensis (strain ATCC BAA-594 / HTCC2503 / KCTC 12087) TaxID=314260 RepID=E0TEG5_PARBH|nr:SsrA-binding protein SmpB [Parvularcula bermudensis]ADM10437.1 SsrA-binding protein [Parvularcula bermudensis HTCC2503]